VLAGARALPAPHRPIVPNLQILRDLSRPLPHYPSLRLLDLARELVALLEVRQRFARHRPLLHGRLFLPRDGRERVAHVLDGGAEGATALHRGVLANPEVLNFRRRLRHGPSLQEWGVILVRGRAWRMPRPNPRDFAAFAWPAGRIAQVDVPGFGSRRAGCPGAGWVRRRSRF